MTRTKENLMAKLESKINYAKQQILAFEKMQNDHGTEYALQNSFRSIEASAHLEVFSRLQKFTETKSIEEMNEIIIRNTSRAQFPEFSTNPISNIYHQFALSAYAEILSFLMD